MIDIRDEKLISLNEARSLPMLSRTIGVGTIYRWCSVGMQARDGTVVKLEVVQEGGRKSTSVEAMQRFFERLAADHANARTPSQEATALKRAQATLEAAGF